MKRTKAIACCFAVFLGATVAADYRLEQMRMLRTSNAYQSPPTLESAAEPGRYGLVPQAVESEKFCVSELRGALSESHEEAYVDLGRFHNLRREDAK